MAPIRFTMPSPPANIFIGLEASEKDVSFSSSIDGTEEEEEGEDEEEEEEKELLDDLILLKSEEADPEVTKSYGDLTNKEGKKE